jgi:hypothetical protein
MTRVSNAYLSVNTEESISKGEYSWGAKAIGRAIERSPRQTYHMLRRGLIKSAKQVGKNYVAHTATLRREFGAE